MLKTLPIGNDDFRDIRENHIYYVDKTLMIKDFIEYRDKVALITRPRRFGKTLSMTMLREFFDITKDSKAIFSGLAIMDTTYAELINSKPVIYFTFKDCNALDAGSLKIKLADIVRREYAKYILAFGDTTDKSHPYYLRFYQVYEMLCRGEIDEDYLSFSIGYLITAVFAFYGIKPIVFIDEYDQPIISSYDHKYHAHLSDFFSSFYGQALKGHGDLDLALLTGIQRVAKESIFSKLNNIMVYTVLDHKYASYFGLTGEETQTLLQYYGLELNEQVRAKYDGYLFGGIEIYNPWSILYYADKKELDNYWINTSTNSLIRESLREADSHFHKQFEQLLIDGEAKVGVMLETSFMELANRYTLWGLFINSGYLTVTDKHSQQMMTVQIPNNEVKSEFQALVAAYTKLPNENLSLMLQALMGQDMDEFLSIYRELVLIYTSFYDAKENAYHMLFLGMVISLGNMYKVTSNIESGHGRSDIMMESKSSLHPHIIIEFKQGRSVAKLKEQALQQILDNRYFAGLAGKILCIGLAHNKKNCELAYKMIEN